MEQAYARALWRTVESGTDAKKAVHALRDVLTVHGREALLPRIARAFGRIAQRSALSNDAVLTVAREKDLHGAHLQARDKLAELSIESKDIKAKIDDTLIGGWRLEGKERLFDNSYKKHLLSVYNRIIQK